MYFYIPIVMNSIENLLIYIQKEIKGKHNTERISEDVTRTEKS